MKKLIFNIYYYFLFKVKNPKEVTTHPRYNKHIKYEFSVGSKHYYRFLNDYDIFENRFRYLQTYYDDANRKVSAKDITDFTEATIKYLNKSEILKAGELQKELQHRVKEWVFEPTTLFKYASVLYFDLQENIEDYDIDYNNSKIEHWSKKKSMLRLILKDLMSGAESLLNLSKEDFSSYLSELQTNLDVQQKLILESGHTSDSKLIEVTI